MPGYRLTRAAADDLVAIYLEGLERFGQTQADSYHAGLEAVFVFLGEYPRAARQRDEIALPIRAHPYKSHLVVYEIAEEDIAVVLRIRHAHEDWLNDPL